VIAASRGPISYKGLSDEVARRLREQILAGELPDGARIVERDVAEEMGLSRGPVRDALRLLEREGLVDWLPRRGARVASITREDTEEFLAIRAAVEPVAVQFFLQSEDPNKFKPLDDCLQRLQDAADAEDWPAVTLAHMEFHSLVYTLSGRRRLERVWELLRVPVLQTFRLHRTFFESIEELPTMHYRILEALKRGPASTAKRVALEHVLEFEQGLLRTLPGPLSLALEEPDSEDGFVPE
jgi:DNA-binding GntR family transcriptional regulator